MESRIRIGQELQKLFRMEEWGADSLVMKTQMKPWFEKHFPAAEVILLPQEKMVAVNLFNRQQLFNKSSDFPLTINKMNLQDPICTPLPARVIWQ